MNKIKHVFVILSVGLLSASTNSCMDKPKTDNQQSANMVRAYNPVVYFEIPVIDIDRAIKFYTSVFNFTFEKKVIDKNEMALFPFTEESLGISGALAKGEIYKPTKDGVVIYFKTENIDETLRLATENGGDILYPKTSNGDVGFVAEFEDSEGNRIALHQSAK
jgi:uncharacterized protein